MITYVLHFSRSVDPTPQLQSMSDRKSSIGYIRFDDRGRFVRESGLSSIESIQATQDRLGQEQRDQSAEVGAAKGSLDTAAVMAYAGLACIYTPAAAARMIIADFRGRLTCLIGTQVA
jgi:hypothetical protein